MSIMFSLPAALLLRPLIKKSLALCQRWQAQMPHCPRLYYPAGQTATPLGTFLVRALSRRQPQLFSLPAPGESPCLSGSCQGAILLLLHVHTLSLADGDALLRQLLQCSPLVIAADLCLAERNLALPATLAAGAALDCLAPESTRQRTAFLRAGGLEGCIWRCHARVLERHGAGGAFRLLVLAGHSAAALPAPFSRTSTLPPVSISRS